MCPPKTFKKGMDYEWGYEHVQNGAQCRGEYEGRSKGAV